MSTDIKRRLGLNLKDCLTTVSTAASHGVHLSIPDPRLILQALRRFLGHREYQKVRDGKFSELCTSFQLLGFESQIEMDMESMFRRGPNWEAGLEHLLVVQAGKAPRFLSTRQSLPIHSKHTFVPEFCRSSGRSSGQSWLPVQND